MLVYAMRNGQVTGLSPQNVFYKLEVQIPCWILWAQTNLEKHIFTCWIHTSKPLMWWTESGGSSKSLPSMIGMYSTQPLLQSLPSNQQLQLVAYIISNIPICPAARRSCHSHHHGLSRRDAFFGNKKVWWCIQGISFMQLCILHFLLLFLLWTQRSVGS